MAEPRASFLMTGTREQVICPRGASGRGETPRRFLQARLGALSPVTRKHLAEPCPCTELWILGPDSSLSVNYMPAP